MDEVQAGFVKDWSIATHIVLAQEILRNLNRKVKGGNVVIKLDMAKAYDKLEWRFLLKALESFGFNAGAMDLIYQNLCNIWYTFRINGELRGSFRSFRGVRLGDPLSPLLFVLAEQVVTINISRRI